MAYLPAMFARADDYILGDAVVTGTTPMTSYTLATLIRRRPEMRVRYNSGSIEVIFTLPTPRRADVFELDVSNLDGATSPSRLVLTNGAGLVEPIPINTMTVNRLPRSNVKDLRIGTPNAATRTSNVWTMTVTGNSVNVILGAFVWLSQLRELDRSFKTEPRRTGRHRGVRHENDYGTDYRQSHETKTASIEVDWAHATDADQLKIADWYDAGHGAFGDPSLFWMDPTKNDAAAGCWQEVYSETLGAQEAEDHNAIPTLFNVLSKGKPV